MAAADEAREEIERLVRQAEYRREFIVTQTVFLSLLPVLYAALIFGYGDRLWTVQGVALPVYSTAMDLPNAPESWGAFFAVMGVGCLGSVFTRHDRMLAGFAIITALIVSAFMISFISDYVRYDAPQALPAGLVYGVIGLSFFNLARLAWVSARNRVKL
ncbi:membrane protein [Gordonia phage LittleMunchkin]|nr:membrane protein [Gordonia phage LittleMunchkin]